MAWDRLRELRKSRELVQEEVAKAIGISRTAYANYETGTRSPDPETLKRIADYFATSIDDLLGYTPKDGDSLTQKEKLILKKYRSLSTWGQERTLRQMEFELGLESDSTFLFVSDRHSSRKVQIVADHRAAYAAATSLIP